MFTNQLSDENCVFSVIFTEYANRYYRKDFGKKHKGKVWKRTEESILELLSLIARNLQKTQKVDELWHKDDYWIFKYDFRIAQSKDSAKSSGNRCICYLDSTCNQVQILMIYSKTHLPKNMKESQYIESVLKSEFSGYLNKCK